MNNNNNNNNNMNNNNMNIFKKGFTLVELIVVITILAILGTIGFISLQGYNKDARDTKRAIDISNIEKSLELFTINNSEYPKPDNFETITYSGNTVWYQGVIGNQVISNLSNLNKKPLDPLLNTEYVYSVTNSLEEYQILALYEGNIITGNLLMNKANAAINYLIPKLYGNYNGVFVKTLKYIISTPSIITAEPIPVGAGLLLNNMNIKSQIITNGKNIIKTKLGTRITGSLDKFNLSIFKGNINIRSSNNDKINAIRQIQKAYSGSSLSLNFKYSNILGSYLSSVKEISKK